jgi:hAT family C-terminal dimerisation region
METFKGRGILDEDDDEDPVAIELTTRGKAAKEVGADMDAKFTNQQRLYFMSPDKIMDYWSQSGATLNPHLAFVARAVLAVPASSGALESDFGGAGHLLSAKRSSMDKAYAEMTLFLHGSRERIPRSIAELSDEQVLRCIPRRLTDPRIVEQTSDLFFEYPETSGDPVDNGCEKGN